MHVQRIAFDEWGRFCERFSRQHHGWLVSVAVTDPWQEANDQPPEGKMLAQNLPLQEVREAQSKGQVDIMITVGKGTEETSFLVENVADVFQNLEEDKYLGMRIDSSNATSTIVQFRAPANPDQLDGLAESES
jgi:hypothetical protein